MKKILLFSSFLFVFTTSFGQLQINDAFKVIGQKSVDDKQYYTENNKHVPYDNISEFFFNVPKTRRHIGEIAYVYDSSKTKINVWQFVGGIDSVNFKIISSATKQYVDSLIDINIVKDITWGVIDSIRNAPSNPVQGDRYLVSTTATGTFTGKQNLIATYDTTLSWQFQSASTGDLLFNSANYNTYKWTGSTWVLRPPLPFNNWWKSSLSGWPVGVYGSSSLSDPFFIYNNNNTQNIGIGYRTFNERRTQGFQNIAIGTESQYQGTGSYNISIGNYSLGYASYGHDQIAIGNQAAIGAGQQIYSISLGTNVKNVSHQFSLSDSTNAMYFKLKTPTGSDTIPDYIVGRKSNGQWYSYPSSGSGFIGGSYIPKSEKGAVNGVATLNASGKVPNSQLPALTVNQPSYVQTVSAMLALSSAVGDIVVVGDSSKSYALMATPGSTFSNWLELQSPVPTNTDLLPEGSTNQYYTNSRARNAISAGDGINYNSSTGEVSKVKPDWGAAEANAAGILNKPVIPAELTPVGIKNIKITGTYPTLEWSTEHIYDSLQVDSIAAVLRGLSATKQALDDTAQAIRSAIGNAKNFAIADLTADSNRTHNFSGRNLTINNIDTFNISGQVINFQDSRALMSMRYGYIAYRGGSLLYDYYYASGGGSISVSEPRDYFDYSSAPTRIWFPKNYSQLSYGIIRTPFPQNYPDSIVSFYMYPNYYLPSEGSQFQAGDSIILSFDLNSNYRDPRRLFDNIILKDNYLNTYDTLIFKDAIKPNGNPSIRATHTVTYNSDTASRSKLRFEMLFANPQKQKIRIENGITQVGNLTDFLVGIDSSGNLKQMPKTVLSNMGGGDVMYSQLDSAINRVRGDIHDSTFIKRQELLDSLNNIVITTPTLQQITDIDSVTSHGIISSYGFLAMGNDDQQIGILNIPTYSSVMLAAKSDKPARIVYSKQLQDLLELGFDSIKNQKYLQFPNTSGVLAQSITNGTDTIKSTGDGVLNISPILSNMGGGDVMYSQLDSAITRVRGDVNDSTFIKRQELLDSLNAIILPDVSGKLNKSDSTLYTSVTRLRDTAQAIRLAIPDVSDVVFKSGTQTISGTKTFTASKTQFNSIVGYPIIGVGTAGNPYVNQFLDVSSGKGGLGFNLWYNNSTSQYEYVDTGAWNSRGAILEVHPTTGVKFIKSTNGTNPAIINTYFSVDTSGNMITSTAKLTGLTNPGSGLLFARLGPDGIIYKRTQSETVSDLGVVQVGRLTDSLQKVRDSIAQLKILIAQLQDSVSKEDTIWTKPGLNIEFDPNTNKQTIFADTVSTTKDGILLANYKTGSGDTLATRSYARSLSGGGGDMHKSDSSLYVTVTRLKDSSIAFRNAIPDVSDVVFKSGTQTISGTKTFTASKTQFNSIVGYPIIGVGTAGNPYVNQFLDVSSGKGGLGFNLWYNNSTSQYEYVNTGAWNSRGAILEVHPTTGVKFIKSTNGTNPAIINTYFSVDTSGNMITSTAKLTGLTNPGSGLLFARLGPDGIIYKRTQSETVSDLGVVQVGRLTDSLQKVRDSIAQLKILIAQLQDSVSKEDTIWTKPGLNIEFDPNTNKQTIFADTVSTTKDGILLANYKTGSGDTLATRSYARSLSGGGGDMHKSDSSLYVTVTRLKDDSIAFRNAIPDISGKVNISDTNSMLSKYLRKVDTTGKWKPASYTPSWGDITGKPSIPSTRINIINSTSNKTLALSDTLGLITQNSSSATTVTIPTNTSVAIPVGMQITVARYGTGTVTIAASGGVTLISADDKTGLRAKGSTATLIKTSTNTWLLVGDIN